MKRSTTSRKKTDGRLSVNAITDHEAPPAPPEEPAMAKSSLTDPEPRAAAGLPRGQGIDAAAKEYANSNAGWPKRTEACDKSS